MRQESRARALGLSGVEDRQGSQEPGRCSWEGQDGGQGGGDPL